MAPLGSCLEARWASSIGFLRQLGRPSSTHTAFRDSGISGVLTLEFHRSGNREIAFPSPTGTRSLEVGTGRWLRFPQSAESRGAVQGLPGFPVTETPWQCLAPTLPTNFGSRALKGEEPRVPLVQGWGLESLGLVPLQPRRPPRLQCSPADQSQNYITRFC